MSRGPNVISELRQVQRENGYVTEAGLQALSKRTGLPLRELYGVASFYPEFNLKQPPRVRIEVCNALPCQMRKSEVLYREIEKKAAGKFDVEVDRCPCLGACDKAPALTINGHLQICTSEGDMEMRLKEAIAVIDGAEAPEAHFPIGITGHFCTDPYEAVDERYGALKALIASGEYGGVIGQIKAANLRGMGGAGKAANRKWEQVAKGASKEKYVVCNADESEPGTLKDREILRNLPHLLVEAMIIGGLTVGATQGYIYLRHEYKAQFKALDAEIKRAKSLMHNGHPLLGKNVGGSGKAFNLEIFVSPGGYIMGEATALLEALEGKRGQPRNQLVDLGMKMGIPSFNGLWGMPTLVNNVETWIYLPLILSKGPEAFVGRGIAGCQGLKWASVCGDVNRPGVFEVPMGTTYRALIEMAGGPAKAVDPETGNEVEGWEAIKAFAPSGPTYGFRTPADLDAKIDFVDPPGVPAGSGAVVVLSKARCMVDAALNFTRFFRNESCGKCVPCRVGSQKMVDLIKALRAGVSGDVPHIRARLAEYRREIEELSDVLMSTSICGLGKVVSVPIQSVLKYWPAEVALHFADRRCPVKVCAEMQGDGE